MSGIPSKIAIILEPLNRFENFFLNNTYHSFCLKLGYIHLLSSERCKREKYSKIAIYFEYIEARNMKFDIVVTFKKKLLDKNGSKKH